MGDEGHGPSSHVWALPVALLRRDDDGEGVVEQGGVRLPQDAPLLTDTRAALLLPCLAAPSSLLPCMASHAAWGGHWGGWASAASWSRRRLAMTCWKSASTVMLDRLLRAPCMSGAPLGVAAQAECRLLSVGVLGAGTGLQPLRGAPGWWVVGAEWRRLLAAAAFLAASAACLAALASARSTCACSSVKLARNSRASRQNSSSAAAASQSSHSVSYP